MGTHRTAFAGGSATITITIGSATKTIEVNVTTTELTGVTVSSDKTTIKIKEVATLSSVVTPTGSTATVTYEVQEGADYVTLDASKGTVTGKAAGTATIVAKATSGDKNLTSEAITITVTNETINQKEVTMKYTGNSTTNMKADVNNALLVGLDETLFNVQSEKCSTSNEVGLNKDGTIRIYNVKDSTDGCMLKVGIITGTIKSITIDWKQQSTVEVKAGDAVVTSTDGLTYDINASSFSIKNIIKVSNSQQAQINSITIVYDSAN